MKKTAFNAIHKELGAKMVEFAGFEMPVQYSSIIEEHKAVRNSLGVFDVSHMGEIKVKGERALDFVQKITTNNAAKLTPGRVQYSAMCYEDGGIVDDLLVYRIGENEFMLVVNASNIEKDFEWMKQNALEGAELVNESDEYSLLAVQGPNSRATLEKLLPEPLDIEFYHFTYGTIADVEMLISRTGYTGELGYELYFKGDENDARKVWDAVFEAGKEFDVKPAGLGARDTLRLEMGYCLYGNDIDETTNPLEAGLGWITKLKKGDFIGRDAILKAKEEGLKRKLVPMIFDERAFPRHGYEIVKNGETLGKVTSGTVSPILNKPIALGYVAIEYAKEGEEVAVKIRNKEVKAKITKLPFVEK
jgi:aminomethyltransferase